eukprot:1845863-Amphidinium_carterae.1
MEESVFNQVLNEIDDNSTPGGPKDSEPVTSAKRKKTEPMAESGTGSGGLPGTTQNQFPAEFFQIMKAMEEQNRQIMTFMAKLCEQSQAGQAALQNASGVVMQAASSAAQAAQVAAKDSSKERELPDELNKSLEK